MELQLKLKIVRGTVLPINYQYLLASWIYKVIERADSQYSSFLHEKGFSAEGKSFKMFTFSQLDLRPYEVRGPLIYLSGKEAFLNVRFLVSQSLEHFITGLFMQQRFGLGDRTHVVDFEVTAVETVTPPIFQSTMTYHALSPICVSKLRPDKTVEYLSPEHPEYGRLLVKNLERKARAVVMSDGSVAADHHAFKLLNTPRKKGIHIKEDTAQHTQLIGYLFRFQLTAPAELHEVGYYAGFGEKNSMGFGCVNGI